MSSKININDTFKQFSDTYSPKIIAELNGQNVMLVRLEGEKVPWHTHENEDEMFLVLEGVLEIHERDKKTVLNQGELYVVNKGIEHRVIPLGHAKIMLFEPAGIAHTGNVESEISKETFDRLYS